MLRSSHRLWFQRVLRVGTAGVVAMLWIFTAPTTAFFWSLFIVWAVLGLDSRVIGVGAITLLVLIPITLSIPEYEWVAEQFAVYVFFLLCITVGLQILELRQSHTDDYEDVPPVIPTERDNPALPATHLLRETPVSRQVAQRVPRRVHDQVRIPATLRTQSEQMGSAPSHHIVDLRRPTPRPTEPRVRRAPHRV